MESPLRLPNAVGAPRLVGVFCPDCDSRAGTIALEGGPTLIRHKSERHRCTREWVVVPDPATGSIAQILVNGREESDRILRSATRSYLALQFRELLVTQPVGLLGVT